MLDLDSSGEIVVESQNVENVEDYSILYDSGSDKNGIDFDLKTDDVILDGGGNSNQNLEIIQNAME